MSLRLAFVEAVESAPGPASPETSAQTAPAPAAAPSPAPEEESHKKFSKKS